VQDGYIAACAQSRSDCVAAVPSLGQGQDSLTVIGTGCVRGPGCCFRKLTYSLQLYAEQLRRQFRCIQHRTHPLHRRRYQRHRRRHPMHLRSPQLQRSQAYYDWTHSYGHHWHQHLRAPD